MEKSDDRQFSIDSQYNAHEIKEEEEEEEAYLGYYKIIVKKKKKAIFPKARTMPGPMAKTTPRPETNIRSQGRAQSFYLLLLYCGLLLCLPLLV
jgi:hypothetical protein